MVCKAFKVFFSSHFIIPLSSPPSLGQTQRRPQASVVTHFHFYLQFGFGQNGRRLFDGGRRLRDSCSLSIGSVSERIGPGLVGGRCAALRRRFASFVVFGQVEVHAEPSPWAGPGLIVVHQNAFEFGFWGLFHWRFWVGWGWLLLSNSQVVGGVGWVKRSVISEVFISWKGRTGTEALSLTRLR